MQRRVFILLAGALSAWPADIPPSWKAALERITAASLSGHLSFLASDLLEGRDTPSRGLDIAAEYIAAQFRRAGLEPAGNDGYFQSFERTISEPDLEGFEFSVASGDTVIRPAAGGAIPADGPVDLAAATVVRLGTDQAAPENMEGKVALVTAEGAAVRAVMQRIAAATRAKPALIVVVDPSAVLARVLGRARILDTPRPPAAAVPLAIVADPGFAAAVAKIAPETAVTATARWKERAARTVKLRNVVAVLRGSDPGLRTTAALLSAHYDHLGALPPGDGDRIYNGANDDASGTVGVVEIASALAALPATPKRSIVFVAFSAEERGGHGSRYYAQNPVFPADRTVANLNLEQIGRTDSTEGERRDNYSVTGFDYSTVSDFLVEAGRRAGVSVYKHEKNSDVYFTRSDNAVLARQGIPAHSLTTAFQYPDYHGLGDHWDKVDFANMEKVTRAIALGLLAIADSPVEPAWNPHNPRAAPYRRLRPAKE
jgi:hypothetical protein